MVSIFIVGMIKGCRPHDCSKTLIISLLFPHDGCLSSLYFRRCYRGCECLSARRTSIDTDFQHHTSAMGLTKPVRRRKTISRRATGQTVLYLLQRRTEQSGSCAMQISSGWIRGRSSDCEQLRRFRQCMCNECLRYVEKVPDTGTQTNWATCQAKAQSCGLNNLLPMDSTYYAPPKNCFQGSVPTYYVDVRKVSDVQATLRFADSTGVPLVIKNSGHDFKGRSSGPNALGLWTHNLQPPIKLSREFTPEGCSAPAGDAVTLGAGQGWGGVYEFAEANNITVVGGSSRTVGPVGGWISGGGHGALTNTLGMGVDNVLQIRTVSIASRV